MKASIFQNLKVSFFFSHGTVGGHYDGEYKLSDTEVTFPCGQRHDQLMRLLLPYSRNISAVESMMEADAMRGQMTTGTLGFTPPT